MYSRNHLTLLANSDAYITAIEAAMERAVHEIYLESYIYENDRTGRQIAESLRKAALRGVKTHLLIDGFGSKRLPQTMIDYLVSAGVMVRKFRPKISPWTLRRRRLRRLHRKIVVVDMTIAFVGGMNIRDDVDTPDQPAPRFDFAVSIEGPLVKEIHTSCRKVWRRVTWLRTPDTVSSDIDYDIPLAEPGGSMDAAFLIRNNFRHRRDIEDAYLQAIGQAYNEIIVASAYFLPGRNFRHALFAAAKRGVRVILLLQGKGDHLLLHSASKALYGSFLDAGIEIHEYHKSFLHAKVAVVDDHWATVGSSNLDPFSLLLALEANIVVDDQHFAMTLKHHLNEAITTGARQVCMDNWKSQPLMLRLTSWISYGLVRIMTGLAGYAPQHDKENPGRHDLPLGHN
jgi:cardiolipin synthase